MKQSPRRLVKLVMIAVPLAGCVGSDQTVFFTTDNLGINVSASPQPVGEIAFSRREGVIEPVFENGRLPTVAASVTHDVPGLFPTSTRTGAVFAGGAAAVIITQGSGPESHCITSRPTGWDGQQLPETGVSRPLFFTTDTTLGFKVSFANASASPPLPDVHLGYKRNEIAVAPLLGQNGDNGCPGKDDPLSARYKVHSPSFLAIAHNGAVAGKSPTDTSSVEIGQIFATGAAAESAAGFQAVKDAFHYAAGKAAQSATGTTVTYGPDPATSGCILAYIKQSPANLAAVQAATEKAKPGTSLSQLIEGTENADLRQTVIRNVPITTCT